MTRNIDPGDLNRSDVYFGTAVTPLYRDDSKTMTLVEVFGNSFVSMSTTLTTEREVLWGEGEVYVDGETRHVEEGSKFTSYPNKSYQEAGNMIILATTTPSNGRTEVFPTVPNRLTDLA